MTLKNLLTLNAIIALLFGLAQTAVPAMAAAPYGVTLSAQGLVFVQLLGAVFIEIGLLCWLARGWTDRAAQRAITLAFFVGNSVGFVVILIAQLSGLGNALSWSSVAIYLVLALGYGYFQFMKQTPD